MDLSRISRDDWNVAGIAFLLVIDLLFLPWLSASANIGAVSISASSTATGVPDGWLGVIAVLAAVAIIVDLAIERFGSSSLPAIGGSRARTRVILTAILVLCLALKFLLHVRLTVDFWGFGFWAAVALTVALVIVALRAQRAEALVGGSHFSARR